MLPQGLSAFGGRGCSPLPPKYSLDFSDIRYTLCSCFSVKPQDTTSAGMCVLQLKQKYVTCNMQGGGERWSIEKGVKNFCRGQSGIDFGKSAEILGAHHVPTMPICSGWDCELNPKGVHIHIRHVEGLLIRMSTSKIFIITWMKVMIIQEKLY